MVSVSPDVDREGRFDAALLVRPHTTAFLFDELKFGDILDHLNLDNSDDVDKLVDRVLAADDDSALDLAEDALGGVALGVDALGLAAKIKALVLLVIKLFLKIKYPDAPKEVERLLRMIARQLDKVGAGAIGAPGGPVTPAGTGGQATPGGTETDKSCVVQTYLKSIKALNLSNIGSRNKWTIDISIGDDDTHTFTDGSFDRSQTPAPFAPIQPEKNRRNIISFPNSGLIKLKVSIKATQSGYRTDDIGEDVVTIEFKCNEPKEDRDVEVRVHNDGKISEPFATLTFTFEISSACTGIPSHTR